MTMKHVVVEDPVVRNTYTEHRTLSVNNVIKTDSHYGLGHIFSIDLSRSLAVTPFSIRHDLHICRG